MKKRVLSVLLAGTLAASMVTSAVVSAGAVKTEHSKYVPGAGVETNKYYFAMPGAWLNDNTKDNNDAAGCYWWEATDSPGDRFDNGWPGYEADKEEGEATVPNMFSIRAPKDASTILWNNYLDGGMDKTKSIFDDAKQVGNKNVENYAWGDSDTYSDSFWTFVYKTAADQLGMDIAEEDIEASVDDINEEAMKHPEKIDFTKVFGDKYGKNFYVDDEINEGLAMGFDNMVYIVDLEHVHMDYTMVPEGKLQYSGEFYFYYGDGEFGMWPTKELAEEHEGTEYFAKDADGNYTAANKFGVVLNEDGQVVIGNFTGNYWTNEDAPEPATEPATDSDVTTPTTPTTPTSKGTEDQPVSDTLTIKSHNNVNDKVNSASFKVGQKFTDTIKYYLSGMGKVVSGKWTYAFDGDMVKFIEASMPLFADAKIEGPVKDEATGKMVITGTFENKDGVDFSTVQELVKVSFEALKAGETDTTFTLVDLVAEKGVAYKDGKSLVEGKDGIPDPSGNKGSATSDSTVDSGKADNGSDSTGNDAVQTGAVSLTLVVLMAAIGGILVLHFRKRAQ